MIREKDNIDKHLSKYEQTSDRGVPMQMHSGVCLYPLDVKEEDIRIEDIAHHLSMNVRFNGAVKYPYSVAQHSWLLSHLVSDENKLCALLHDAPEAILGDMIRPIKYLFPKFIEIENNIWAVIARKYGLPQKIPEEVKLNDTKICFTEKRDCLNPSVDDIWGDDIEPHKIKIKQMSWQESKQLFLGRFEELYNG